MPPADDAVAGAGSVVVSEGRGGEPEIVRGEKDTPASDVGGGMCQQRRGLGRRGKSCTQKVARIADTDHVGADHERSRTPSLFTPLIVGA